MEMNEEKNIENRSDGDGKKIDDDKLMYFTEAELLKIEEKKRKAKRMMKKNGRKTIKIVKKKVVIIAPRRTTKMIGRNIQMCQ